MMRHVSLMVVVAGLATFSSSLARAGTFACTGAACSPRIPDGWSQASATIDVTDTCPLAPVAAVQVGVSLAHGNVGDLVVTLIAPNGASVRLLDRPMVTPEHPLGCASHGMEGTFADNGAASTCPVTLPGLTGTVAPSQALTGLNGAARNGTWRLTVSDAQRGGGYGRLKGWSLTLPCETSTVTIHAGSPTVSEGSAAIFTVRRADGPQDAALRVPLLWTGAAANPQDMDPLPSAVNIPAGASSATVSVAALQDATPEEPEPLRVQLGAGPFLVGNPDSAQVLVVGPATQTSLTSAANPALLDAPVTLGVVVAGTGTVTGSVALMLDGNFLARAYLVDGHASFTVAPGTLGRGSFLFTAEYGGGVDQAPSSASLTQYVDVATVVTLAASESAPAVGQPVTFTAAVADAGRVAMGTIQFLDGTRTLASVPLSGGVATWTTQELAPGTHSLKARHSTAENPQLGESQPVTVAVGVLPTTTTLAASRATATTFEPVSLLATVASTGPAAEGLVTFKAGITTLGYATLSSGAAALTMTLPQGTLAVVAEYAGSTTHAASTSTAVTVEVSTAQLVAPASETSKSACGCTSSAEGVPASAWLALLLLGIPLRRRR